MQPQGTAVSNPDVIQQLTAEINAVNLCRDLQALVTAVFAKIQAEVNALEAQIAALEPIKILLSIPTDLNSVIQWIEGMINDVITPLYKPYLTAILRLEQIVQEIAQLTAAITAAIARCGSCAITIPTIAITIPTPPVTVTTSGGSGGS